MVVVGTAQTTYPLRRFDVLSEVQSDGSGVLYDPDTRVAYALSASAVMVWDECDGTQPSATIAGRLAGVYDAPQDVIVRDVDALLSDLDARGLLTAIPRQQG